MSVAYSPPDRVIHADLSAVTSECLRKGLHVAVQMAGWQVDRALENGWVYILTSPQDAALQCKVKIFDTGRTIFGGGVIEVQFCSLDEDPAYDSWAYILSYGTYMHTGLPMRLRVHVTPCQIFTYVPGQITENVMGGIPYLDPNALASTIERCADEDNEIKIWRFLWSAGNRETVTCVHNVYTFRDAWLCNFSGVVRNDLRENMLVSPFADPRLRMLPFNRPNSFAGAWGNANWAYPVMMRWMGTDEPLLLDALFTWGQDLLRMPVLGQLWDALVRTKAVPWESPLVFDDIPFFSYSNGRIDNHWYSPGDIHTMYLRDPGLTVLDCPDEPPAAPAESNYAY